MLEHYIDDKGIYHLRENGKDKIKIELNRELDQVVVETNYEVFAGPADELEFATIPTIIRWD